MEQLLILGLVLFSIASAILERRKRAKQLEMAEEARRARQGQPGAEPEASELEEEEGPQEFWPFPMGDDPFEPARPKRQEGPPQEEQVEGDIFQEGLPEPMPPTSPRAVDLVQELERQAREVEERTKLAEQKAQETVRQAREAQPHQPRRRMRDLVEERMGRKSAPCRQRKWKLTPDAARDAVVLAEILGRPVGERSDQMWRA